VKTHSPGCQQPPPLQDWILYWISKKMVSYSKDDEYGLVCADEEKDL